MVRGTDQVGPMKRIGRPPVAAHSVRVSVRIAVDDYDRLDRVARKHNTSVPDVIRRRLSASKSQTA